MGIQGLWEVLKPAAVKRSMLEMPVSEGFEANANNLRGYRVGIDASIWFFHAEYGREGENPELRTLFFRCATLMHAPWLPLFVFDGPKRPSWKRGKRISKTNHALINGMKAIVEAFGFEWRMAPGEAEAELAYLNRIGLIDGVLSDDSDNFLFGALTVIRNPSNNLSANRAQPVLNADGRDDKQHTMVYKLADITSQLELTRGGLILIGLMAGGDYEQAGLPDCGIKVATGLARCGFGDSLYEAANNLPDDDLEDFLDNWRNELRHELRTNARGKLPSKRKKLANSLPDSFPSVKILKSYTCPITTESMGRAVNNERITWARDPNLAALARTCELNFEWGYKDIIVKRFRTVIWPGAILRILRRAVLDGDARRPTPGVPTTPRKNRQRDEESGPASPSKLVAKYFSGLSLSSPEASSDDEEEVDDIVVKIHSSRTHASTDGMLEYRLEVAPRALVRAAESGVQGTRRPLSEDEWSADSGSEEDVDSDGEPRKKSKGAKKPPAAPDSHLRVWVPAAMVRATHPRMVREYEEKKACKKVGRGKAKAKASSSDAAARKKSAAKKVKAKPIPEEDEESDVISAPVLSRGKKADEPRPAPLRSRTNSSQTSRGSARSLLDDLDALSPPCSPSKKPKSKAPRPAPRPPPATLPLFDEEEESPSRISTRPSKRTVADSDDELPPNVCGKSKVRPTEAVPKGSVRQPTKPLKYVAISSSDDDDDGLLPDPEDMFSSRTGSSHLGATASTGNARKKAAPSSGSDSDRVAFSKSPRKSKEHSSPRKTKPMRRTSPSPQRRPSQSRSVSPSAVRRRVAPPAKPPRLEDMSIIELTSDEGTPAKPPPSRAGVPSLMAARQRVQARTGITQQSIMNFTQAKKRTTVKLNGKLASTTTAATVIDLTI